MLNSAEHARWACSAELSMKEIKKKKCQYFKIYK